MQAADSRSGDCGLTSEDSKRAVAPAVIVVAVAILVATEEGSKDTAAAAEYTSSTTAPRHGTIAVHRGCQCRSIRKRDRRRRQCGQQGRKFSHFISTLVGHGACGGHQRTFSTRTRTRTTHSGHNRCCSGVLSCYE